jgi:type II secretory pathway pseudopilin PulG
LTPSQSARRRRQAGYTLIEVVIATAIGLFVMGSLTSIVLTTVLAANTATSRVEASNQVRGLQLAAYDDFALSRPPAPCGTAASPCTTPLVLRGKRMPNQATGAPADYSVTYLYDPAKQVVTRQIGSSSRNAANNVTAYSWYTDNSGIRPTVVISLTVTVGFYNTTYSQSQTMRFYPRVTA